MYGILQDPDLWQNPQHYRHGEMEEVTKCWAKKPNPVTAWDHQAACNAFGTKRLGLCPMHDEEILG